ncbi:hypothetical protein [Marinomonas sp. 2405UD68-3]|uniref:hypothetical protein n=1 Tax=Marinomonas sp. 2405UD68-3 TaxID=3391835 RepID=UPI0039C9B4DB
MRSKYSITKALCAHVPLALELGERDKIFYEFYSYSKFGFFSAEDLYSKFERAQNEAHYLVMENKLTVIGWIVFVFRNEQKTKAEILIKVRKNYDYTDVMSHSIRSLLPVLGCIGLEHISTKVDANNQLYCRIFEEAGLTPIKQTLPDSNLNKFIVHLTGFYWCLD